MRTIIDKGIAPIGGWRYVDPDTGYKYNDIYHSLDKLCEHVARYRSQNKLSVIPNIKDVIYDWLCSQEEMADRCCDVKELKRTWKQLFSGVKQIAKTAISQDYVQSPIAEKRALLCEKCPYNKYNKEDMAFYSNVFLSITNSARSVPNQNRLFTCEICNCILAVKVHHTQKSIKANLNKELKQKFAQGFIDSNGKSQVCWQIQE